MKRRLLFLLVIMMSLSGMAQGNLSDVYFPDVNVQQGGTGEMVVTWNNREENDIFVFEIDFLLPEGINLVDAQFGEKSENTIPK